MNHNRFCAAALAWALSPLAFAQQPSAPISTAPQAPPVNALSPGEPQLSESVVASVNDEIISSWDIVQRMRLLSVTAGIQITDQNSAEIQQEAARSLIDEHLELQDLRNESKTQKFDLIASDAEVDDELADIARANNTTATALLQQIAAQGVAPQTMREQIRAEISWRGWIRGRYGQRLIIGEDQIKAFQKREDAEAGKPRYQIAEIFVDANRAGGISQAEQTAEQLISQLKKGAPLAAVARQFSSAPSAAAGGEVGWISTGEMPPEVDRALDEMRPSQLSPPIPTHDGVYIIYLRDKQAGSASNVVNLKQAAVSLPKDATPEAVAAATEKLNALRTAYSGCATLSDVAAKYPGVVAGDLGEAETKDLAPAFRTAAETVPVGKISEPIRTDIGLHLVAVCDRHTGGAQALTREQIENRLYGEELSMIAKRALRDLRNSATIELR
jgi:peptidyl-prolyl cis-trans isomerase SurA